MRIFVGNRINRIIEKDLSILKFNFGSRKLYSIDKAILEKWMICNSSQWIMKQNTHIIIDLSAYYDWQLANIESVVAESTGINWNISKLIAKVILAF